MAEFSKNSFDCMLEFEKVEDLILNRLQQYSLSSVLQYDTEEFNYCDRISHLFLCIIAVDYPHFRNSFINGEIRLFQQRLKNVNLFEIKKELLETSEFLNDLLQNEEIKKFKSVRSNQFQLVQNVIQAMISKSGHSFKRVHSNNCRKYKLTVPFTFPLKLVAKREVEVKNGKVSISCGQWSKILELVFEFLLKLELFLIDNCYNLKKKIYESEDDRLRQIITRFKNLLIGNLSYEKKLIRADEIDHETVYFPPCMAGIHQILRRCHRLSYDSRFQYTLFLKDIGLSVDENILFWKNEYEKLEAGSSCTHDWQEKGTRYKYQIQHLYGLIGSHGLKTSHSCDKFIQELQPKMDGGCPFQHLTSEQLAKAFPESMIALPDVEDIFTFKSKGLPQRACAAYLHGLEKVFHKKRKSFREGETNGQQLFYVVSPLQFYSMAKNFSD